MTDQHYHPCNAAHCADWGYTANDLIEAARGAEDEGVFEAHRDGRDCQRTACATCGR